MPQVTLSSSDGETFAVDVEVARMSSTIRTMLDDLGLAGEGPADEETIPLPNVRGEILRLVLNWCTHHKVKKQFFIMNFFEKHDSNVKT